MTSTTAADQHRGMPVHPVADLFPMLPNDELKELAADITERGLLQPIVLDAEGRILDGRNRYAACQLAGVEPTFTTYDGTDPDGYALAVNIARRHLSKGQQAMIASRGVRNFSAPRSNRELARTFGVDEKYMRMAYEVLDNAPDLADAVVAGSLALNNAYEEARKRKQAAESTEAQMASLRSTAPDLADQVTEERLTLAEALAALRAREAQRESERRAAISNLRSVLTYLTSTVLNPDDLAADYADAVGEFQQQQISYAAQTMTAIAKMSRK
ncbi:MAG: ParB/RepB/Spo0J family partition protein [Pseudonocardiaceae bacterium]